MIQLYCGRCGARLSMCEGAYSLMYKCKSCGTHLSLRDVNRIIKAEPEGDFRIGKLIGRAIKSGDVKKIIIAGGKNL